MNAQLERIEQEFRAAQARLDRLAEQTPPELWSVRPGPGRWSVAECVGHLNRTAEAFVPRVRAVLAAAGRERRPRRYRRDLAGWLLSVVMPPPVRLIRAKTTSAFEAPPDADPGALTARFRELQEEQIELLHAADGRPLNQLRIASPFNERVRYNLYSCFVILPRHQERHLWQAEQALDTIRSAGR